MADLLICPLCNNYANRQNTAYGQRNACLPCGLWSWGNKPLTDQATHKARQEAHESLDPIWKEKHLTRTETYEWLQKAMRLTYIPHIAEMEKLEARAVTSAAKLKLQQLRSMLKQ